MTAGKTSLWSRFTLCMSIVAVALLALAAQPAFADKEQACSVATLHGLYIFDASGFINLGAGWVPKAVVEFLEINGDSTLTSIATANIAGNVPGHDVHGTGSYTVNPDCTGTLTFSPSNFHFDIFVAPGGGQFHMIQTDAANVLAGPAKRVFRDQEN